MKCCPNCNDMAFYEDREIVCPICHSALVLLPARPGARPLTGEGEDARRRRVVTPDTFRPSEKRTRPPVSQPNQRQTADWGPPQESQRPGRGRRQVVDPIAPPEEELPDGDPIIRDGFDFPDYNDRSANRRTVRPRTSDTRNSSAPRFDETINRREHIFRGRIAEVNSHSRYYNRFHKIVNMIFRREPYQFGNASYETVIRIEEFTDGRLPSQWRDLVFYGDVEGSVHVGDDVEVHAVQSGGRYVIRSLHNNQTESNVAPGPQMSVLAGSLLAAVIAAVFASLIYGIYAFFTKGGFDMLVMTLVNLALTVFVKLLPIFAVLMILRLFIGIGRKR